VVAAIGNLDVRARLPACGLKGAIRPSPEISARGSGIMPSARLGGGRLATHVPARAPGLSVHPQVGDAAPCCGLE